MTQKQGVAGYARFILPVLTLGFLLTSCDDDPPPTGSNPPTTTTAPPSTASAFLRAAPLTFDARTVDVVVDGAGNDETITGISYAGVSGYLELAPGDYRVQFFPVGSRRAALAETTVTLSADEAVTVALVGLSAIDVIVFEDDRADSSGSAGVTMTNAIPDFPTPLDLVVVNGPMLIQNIGYLETSGAVTVIPGSYDIQLRRAGTDEPVATSTGHDFSAGATYTVFAVGSLTHGDMGIVVGSDMP